MQNPRAGGVGDRLELALEGPGAALVPRADRAVAQWGRRMVFWGGGVDTQQLLGTASHGEIRDHVRRNIDTLAPGGGFVFAAVHDIQANVPPENVIAMWEAWREYGVY